MSDIAHSILQCLCCQRVRLCKEGEGYYYIICSTTICMFHLVSPSLRELNYVLKFDTTAIEAIIIQVFKGQRPGSTSVAFATNKK